MSLLRDVFLVSLDPKDPAEYTFVGNLENVSDLTVDSVDPIVLYQLTENEELQEQPLQYLNSCFRRCQQFKRISKKNADEMQAVTLQEIDRLIVGYALVCFQIEEFAIKGSFQQYLVDILQELDKYTDILTAMINRATQEGTLFEFVNNLFQALQVLSLIHI